MAEKSNSQEVKFSLQRIFSKNISFESPKSPNIFNEKWKPEVKLDLGTKHNTLPDNHYEVILSVTATVENKKENDQKETAFVAEIEQAGIFMIQGLHGGELEETLGAFCPTMLFPYAREAIDNLILRGNFPPLMLSPVNFNALFEQAKKQAAEEGKNANNKLNRPH